MAAFSWRNKREAEKEVKREEGSFVPRPSNCPVFDCLQYAKTEREAWSIL